MRKRDAEYHQQRINRDLIIIILSIIIATLLSTSDILTSILSITQKAKFLEIFAAGALFTSIFTTPIAIAAFLKLAGTTNIAYLAIVGGLGAVIGDLLIFAFVKDNLSEDISYVLSAPRYKKLRAIFKFRIFRWLVPLIGALVIASPIPDEIGLAMMGFSKMKLGIFIPISLLMNVLGIYLIAIAATAL